VGLEADTDAVAFILDFLKGKMLPMLTLAECCRGRRHCNRHLLAAEKGRIGEALYFGRTNMTLKQILDAALCHYGASGAACSLPHAVCARRGICRSVVLSRLAGREPQIPVEGVKMSRHRIFVEK